ncbi:hypothetical protein NC661_07295 [Aquibacillus koreensis]|uniref:Uncharacterized protein n=2 Tax=Aquibacillus koreensis TaxID=279446 RepID=A0A9X4AJB7_9BACI|nr:hypothetical protein [Aquibacillus koreensis]MCT2535542.1 hypothetical protein [Aquibacillus koreensis]MDC3420173.1 hypothetical protein [Aquibacillus koreensis]
MYVCPVCNGLTAVTQTCPKCQHSMDHQGRLVDFMGDYIAYLEYEGTKLIDGDEESTNQHTCVHLYACPSCGEELDISIKEVRE